MVAKHLNSVLSVGIPVICPGSVLKVVEEEEEVEGEVAEEEVAVVGMGASNVVSRDTFPENVPKVVVEDLGVGEAGLEVEEEADGRRRLQLREIYNILYIANL